MLHIALFEYVSKKINVCLFDYIKTVHNNLISDSPVAFLVRGVDDDHSVDQVGKVIRDLPTNEATATTGDKSCCLVSERGYDLLHIYHQAIFVIISDCCKSTKKSLRNRCECELTVPARNSKRTVALFCLNCRKMSGDRNIVESAEKHRATGNIVYQQMFSDAYPSQQHMYRTWNYKLILQPGIHSRWRDSCCR